MSDCMDSLALIMSGKINQYDLWYFGNGDLRRSKEAFKWVADEYTSAKDRLRWSKLSEWLDKYQRQNPAKEITQPRPEGELLRDLFRRLDVDVPGPADPMFLTNASDFPRFWLLNPSIYHDAWGTATLYILDKKLFITILVVLSLVYGGVHLSAWNFAFASETEHLLWKIACIDTMATVPIALLCTLGGAGVIHLATFTSLSEENDLYYRFFWALILALSLFYGPLRIYIVLEAFISLRHVPIGTYAAVPWVQAIPHI